MDALKEKIPPEINERLSGLARLAFNLWWSWQPAARMLYKTLNRPEWKMSGHNPVKMLHGLDRKIIDEAASDERFLRHYDAVMARFRYEVEDGWSWFFNTVTKMGTLPIAFFSAEYGLHHSLPFYAGGLGFLAGDFLKEASDLGMPMVAIGFMYPEGYLRQKITADGLQMGQDEPVDRPNAPIARVVDDGGEPLMVKVPVIEPPVYVALWRIRVGRVPLYLMDTDIDANDPWNRNISDRLYIANAERRLRQEIVLGIGGAEVLNTLGIKHSILHLNEGHPGFAVLERIRERVNTGMGFDEAFGRVRDTTLFTTHTPVAAGMDIYPFELMEKYFNAYWPALKLDREKFFGLGINPADPKAGFNMTAFALKTSAYHNAVSQRHGEVARRMWQPLWPAAPPDKVPIESITNGVHVPTWIEPKLELLFNRYLGVNWLMGHDNPEIWKLVMDIPDEELWQTHLQLKMKLIMRIMERGRERWVRDNPDTRVILASGILLDPNALTIGFARRFAAYKRAALILEDPERLKKILCNKWMPVQIIFSGKAHPDDDAARHVLQRVFKAAEDPAFEGRIAFVEDYNQQIALYMVHGSDLWLNTPAPPMEACGTSGMKASLNGVPNLSILDGWWIEGYNGKNGWAFEGKQTDREDAESIYRLLENEIIPLFYQRDENGTPLGWLKVMKEAIVSIAARFSARRMVKEYVEKFYAGALKAAAE